MMSSLNKIQKQECSGLSGYRNCRKWGKIAMLLSLGSLGGSFRIVEELTIDLLSGKQPV